MMWRQPTIACVCAIMCLDVGSSFSSHKVGLQSVNQQRQQRRQQQLSIYTTRSALNMALVDPLIKAVTGLKGGANGKRAWETAVKRGMGGFPAPLSWEPMDEEELRVMAESLLTHEIPDPVIEQFVPTRAVLWRKWKGTMLEETWGAILFNITLALVVCFACQRLQLTHPRLSDQLCKIDTIWKIHMTLTTFILTFFVNQSYAMWRGVYKAARRLQGRQYNLLMLTTTHLKRERPSSFDGGAAAPAATASASAAGDVVGARGAGERKTVGSPGMKMDAGSESGHGVVGKGAKVGEIKNEGGGVAGRVGSLGGAGDEVGGADPSSSNSSNNKFYHHGNSIVTDSQLWLNHFERYMRLWHILYYAGCSRKHACYCTDAGLERLHLCGLINEAELPLLRNFPGPAAYRHVPVFQWMVAFYIEAMEEGRFHQSATLTTRVMEQFVALRDFSGGIGDMVGGRTKLAYAHAVQLLVDVFLLLTPFALFSEVGFWAIAATGVLTTFYQGLFNLSKTFIDPLNNEDATIDSDCIVIDSLIKESANMGARWKHGVLVFPF